MSWAAHLRPGITELAPFRPFAYGSGPGLIRLDCNEAPFSIEDDELAELRSELGKLPLNRYPDVSGESLRRTLADRWRVDPEQILLGNGSIEVLALLVTAFGGGRSGRPAKLLYPDPSFPHYSSRTVSGSPSARPRRTSAARTRSATHFAATSASPALARRVGRSRAASARRALRIANIAIGATQVSPGIRHFARSSAGTELADVESSDSLSHVCAPHTPGDET